MIRLGILAGGGRLPLVIAESVSARGGHVHIVAIEGAADADVARFPHTWVNLGQVGRIVAALSAEGRNELVIAGNVRRPDLWTIRPDAGFFTSLPQVFSLLAGGDDSVLSRVVRFFESKGLTVRGAHEVAPDLLAEAGQIGAVALSPQSYADALLGFAVRGALGPLDAGQAVAVAGRRVLAIEGAEGTDAMLERVAAMAGPEPSGGRLGVLTKGPKPGQELRVDMPAIGPRTIERAVAAGLAGVAVEAGGVLMLDRAEAIRVADARSCAIEGLANRVAPQVVGTGAGGMTGRVMGRIRPSARDRVDVAKGLAAVQRLERFDTGGAVVVARAYILAFAAAESAAAMLDRVGALRQWGGRGTRRVGVLVCRSDQAADAAAVQQLFDAAARQGLAGVAIVGLPDALARYEDQIALSDAQGLFLVTCPVSNEG
jgi:UDP-2,3-diacylglucosamine hydrolase